jgi:putative tryptophan/tyrosine transport system substrate-binding protein
VTAFNRNAAIAQGGPLSETGLLMTFAANSLANCRRAAYVDHILSGAKPADLPVEQITQLEPIINNKTAQSLGFTMPQELLLRADMVIE